MLLLVQEALDSPGRPLDSATRAAMESRLSHDFSQVRVHTNSRAAASARAVGALAYTMGRDIVFGAGRYAPETVVGEGLLAHELAHVAQRLPQGLIALMPEHSETDADAGTEELAVPPAPMAAIILVGSPTDPATGYDKYAYNFTDASSRAVPKTRTSLPGTQVTILFFSPGYKLRGDDVYQKARADLQATGADVLEVTSAEQVVSFLNTGLITPIESTPTRAVKVTRFFYFGHGTADQLLLNWGWGKEFSALRKSSIVSIKTEAFSPAGESYLFTCNVAEGVDTFMSIWTAHLGQTSTGPQGNAAFNARYDSSDLEKGINKHLPSWFLGLPYLNRVKIIDPTSKK